MDKHPKSEEVKTAAQVAWERAKRVGKSSPADGPSGHGKAAAKHAAETSQPGAGSPETVGAEPGPSADAGPGAQAPAGTGTGVGEAPDYLGDLQRLQAEFENYKKRMVREQTNFLQIANKDLVEKLLPVIDDLDRAVAVSEESKDFDKLAEGVHLIRSRLMKVLEAQGLEVIEPHGTEFDPVHSEAVMQVESDEHDEHTVLEVLQKGFRLKGRLIRPAMVKVSGKSK